MDAIARHLGRDPLEIRKLNLYGKGERNITPYRQTVEDNVLPEIIAELETSADYAARRRAIAAFNAESPYLKRGLALTPVKFGISFTTTHLNQAGALVHVYTDGTDPPEPRRHRDGPGPVHQGGAGGGRGVPGRPRPRQDHRHHHRQGAQHLGHRRLVRHRPQRHGGPGGGPHHQGAPDRLRRRAFRRAAPEAVAFPTGNACAAAPAGCLRRAGARWPIGRRVSLSATGYYQTPKIHYDRATHRGPAVLLFRLWRGGVARWRSTR